MEERIITQSTVNRTNALEFVDDLVSAAQTVQSSIPVETSNNLNQVEGWIRDSDSMISRLTASKPPDYVLKMNSRIQGYTTSKGSYGERKLQDNKMKLIRIFYENALKVTRGEGNFIFKEELVEEFEASYLPKNWLVKRKCNTKNMTKKEIQQTPGLSRTLFFKVLRNQLAHDLVAIGKTIDKVANKRQHHITWRRRPTNSSQSSSSSNNNKKSQKPQRSQRPQTTTQTLRLPRAARSAGKRRLARKRKLMDIGILQDSQKNQNQKKPRMRPTSPCGLSKTRRKVDNLVLLCRHYYNHESKRFTMQDLLNYIEEKNYQKFIMCDYKDMEELEDSIDEAVAGGWLEWIGDEGELKINRDGREYALEMIKESRYVSPRRKRYETNFARKIKQRIAPDNRKTDTTEGKSASGEPNFGSIDDKQMEILQPPIPKRKMTNDNNNNENNGWEDPPNWEEPPDASWDDYVIPSDDEVMEDAIQMESLANNRPYPDTICLANDRNLNICSLEKAILEIVDDKSSFTTFDLIAELTKQKIEWNANEGRHLVRTLIAGDCLKDLGKGNFQLSGTLKEWHIAFLDRTKLELNREIAPEYQESTTDLNIILGSVLLSKVQYVCTLYARMDNRLDTINRELGSKRFKLLVSAGITHKRSISEGIEQLRSLRKIGKEGEFKPATYRNNVIKNVINVAERLQLKTCRSFIQDWDIHHYSCTPFSPLGELPEMTFSIDGDEMIVTNERLFFLIAHNDWTTFRALFKSYSTQAGKPDQIIIDNKFLSNFGKVTQGNDRILSSKVPRMQGLIRKKLFGNSKRILADWNVSEGSDVTIHAFEQRKQITGLQVQIHGCLMSDFKVNASNKEFITITYVQKIPPPKATTTRNQTKHLIGSTVVGGTHTITLLFKVQVTNINWLLKSPSAAGMDILVHRDAEKDAGFTTSFGKGIAKITMASYDDNILEETWEPAYTNFCEKEELQQEDPESYRLWRELSPNAQEQFRLQGGSLPLQVQEKTKEQGNSKHAEDRLYNNRKAAAGGKRRKRRPQEEPQEVIIISEPHSPRYTTQNDCIEKSQRKSSKLMDPFTRKKVDGSNFNSFTSFYEKDDKDSRSDTCSTSCFEEQTPFPSQKHKIQKILRRADRTLKRSRRPTSFTSLESSGSDTDSMEIIVTEKPSSRPKLRKKPQKLRQKQKQNSQQKEISSPSQTSENLPRPPNDQSVKCRVCGLWFTLIRPRYSHRMENRSIAFVCQKCPKKFLQWMFRTPLTRQDIHEGTLVLAAIKHQDDSNHWHFFGEIKNVTGRTMDVTVLMPDGNVYSEPCEMTSDFKKGTLELQRYRIIPKEFRNALLDSQVKLLPQDGVMSPQHSISVFSPPPNLINPRHTPIFCFSAHWPYASGKILGFKIVENRKKNIFGRHLGRFLGIQQSQTCDENAPAKLIDLVPPRSRRWRGRLLGLLRLSRELTEEEAILLDPSNTISGMKHFAVVEVIRFSTTISIRGEQQVYAIDNPDTFDDIQRAVVKEKDLSFWEKICDQYDSGKQAELQLEVENLLQKMLKKAHQEKIVSDHDADAIMNIDTETSQNAAKKNIQSPSDEPDRQALEEQDMNIFPKEDYEILQKTDLIVQKPSSIGNFATQSQKLTNANEEDDLFEAEPQIIPGDPMEI